MKQFKFLAPALCALALLGGCTFQDCSPSRKYEPIEVTGEQFLAAAKDYSIKTNQELLSCLPSSESIAVAQMTVQVKKYTCTIKVTETLSQALVCEPARLSNNATFAYCHVTDSLIYKAS